MEPECTLTIDEAARLVADATAIHADAAMNCSAARTTECNALNALNRAQAALDQAIASVRKNAPGQSDWGRRDRQAKPPEA